MMKLNPITLHIIISRCISIMNNEIIDIKPLIDCFTFVVIDRFGLRDA